SGGQGTSVKGTVGDNSKIKFTQYQSFTRSNIYPPLSGMNICFKSKAAVTLGAASDNIITYKVAGFPSAFIIIIPLPLMADALLSVGWGKDGGLNKNGLSGRNGEGGGR